MTASVGSVMRYCRNYFEKGYIDGTFRITGNALSDVGDGVHWVYISGSMMHDGVWQICNGYLTGRSIDGRCIKIDAVCQHFRNGTLNFH